jgi:HlyD family secretion protein
MSASADIQTKTHVNVLSVPINAVTTRDKNDSTAKVAGATKAVTDKAASSEDDLEVVVFIVDKEGTVKKVKVTTAIQDINYIEITEGLKEGDNVISGPYDVVSKLLKEKDKVKVVDKKDLFEKVKE